MNSTAETGSGTLAVSRNVVLGLKLTTSTVKCSPTAIPPPGGAKKVMTWFSLSATQLVKKVRAEQERGPLIPRGSTMSNCRLFQSDSGPLALMNEQSGTETPSITQGLEAGLVPLGEEKLNVSDVMSKLVEPPRIMIVGSFGSAVSANVTPARQMTATIKTSM